MRARRDICMYTQNNNTKKKVFVLKTAAIQNKRMTRKKTDEINDPTTMSIWIKAETSSGNKI